MPRRLLRFAVTLLCASACLRVANGQNASTASVTITGNATASATGSITISFQGFSETVVYGPLSTPTSIAAGLAARFSVDSPGARICAKGLCAKAFGPRIQFQFTTAGSSFGPVPSGCGSGTPFGVDCSSWPQSSRASTSLLLSTSANPVAAGQPLTIGALLTINSSGNTAPSGTVTFFDGATPVGSTPLSSSSGASITISTLSIGTHSLSATYSGDSAYSAATSSHLQESVTQQGGPSQNCPVYP